MELLFRVQIGASSNTLWKKLTSRASRFLDILLLIYYVRRRGLTIPLNTLLSTFSLVHGCCIKGTIASWTFMLLHLNSLFNVFWPEVLAHELSG